jgi:ABC-type multidrug transport system fused ATPase/permease subunit
MYPVDGGRVKIDSRDIASVSLKRLRRSMVIIPQEPTLFAGTLRFNLDPLGACSDAQIWECLNQIELLDEGVFFYPLFFR